MCILGLLDSDTLFSGEQRKEREREREEQGAQIPPEIAITAENLNFLSASLIFFSGNVCAALLRLFAQSHTTDPELI